MNFFDLAQLRRSVRDYKLEPVAEKDLNYILECTRLAPSAKNLQPWKLIIVQNSKTIEDLSLASCNQKFMKNAPVVVVFCGLTDRAFSKLAGKYSCIDVDVSCAITHFILAAAERKLGTCWIGAFDEDKVKTICKIPSDIRVVSLVTLGYFDTLPNLRSRKQLKEIIAEEGWI